ncbi:cytochrome P450 [Streptomyces hirsutus]|uniref:cytochrome P450 n=1 Tax=Streptomyces hirsutus TaxID=35620 RepID=UPI003327C4F9
MDGNENRHPGHPPRNPPHTGRRRRRLEPLPSPARSRALPRPRLLRSGPLDARAGPDRLWFVPRFGDGRRKCIGENFAWTELQIILSTDLQLWPRMELASRTPRAQAVATVKPDTMAIVLESVRMVIPAVREARRPVRTCCCTIQVGLVETAASSERNEIRYTVGVADNPVP